MPHLAHDAKLLTPRAKLSRARLAIYAGLTALVGIVVVVVIFAATGSLAFEAESGTLSGAATVATVTGASGGQAVQFGGGATPTPTATPSGGWPDASNTGIPAGTTLATYTGPTTITSCGTVIDSKTINSDITIRAGNSTHSSTSPCVTIKNSKINGIVDAGSNASQYGPLVMTDDEINAGTGSDQSTILMENYYLWRVNIHGGAKGAIQCDGYCEVHDSWTHDFFLAGASHYDGVGSNGTGGAPFLLDHNTIACSFYNSDPSATGGCSADVGFFGDFATISNVTVNNNLFVASPFPSYCFDTNADKPGKAFPTADHLVVTNNTFQRGSNGKCGQYGPIDNWASGNGNVWTGNKWDDGSALNE